MEERIIVAIDGPAASGKSTVARRVARELGCLFVNSGEMYRAFTWWVLHNDIEPEDRQAVIDLLHDTSFTCGEENKVGTIEVQGRRLSEKELRSDQVNGAVSAVAAIPEVRARLVAEQRSFADDSSVVMEGRDIGSVVFRDTPLKFFIDAAPEIRAQRRNAEGITDSVEDRDIADSLRSASPLTVADDAMVVDSSYLSVEEVVQLVVDAIRWKSADQ